MWVAQEIGRTALGLTDEERMDDAGGVLVVEAGWES